MTTTWIQCQHCRRRFLRLLEDDEHSLCPTCRTRYEQALQQRAQQQHENAEPPTPGTPWQLRLL